MSSVILNDFTLIFLVVDFDSCFSSIENDSFTSDNPFRLSREPKANQRKRWLTPFCSSNLRRSLSRGRTATSSRSTNAWRESVRYRITSTSSIFALGFSELLTQLLHNSNLYVMLIRITRTSGGNRRGFTLWYDEILSADLRGTLEKTQPKQSFHHLRYQPALRLHRSGIPESRRLFDAQNAENISCQLSRLRIYLFLNPHFISWRIWAAWCSKKPRGRTPLTTRTGSKRRYTRYCGSRPANEALREAVVIDYNPNHDHDATIGGSFTLLHPLWDHVHKICIPVDDPFPIVFDVAFTSILTWFLILRSRARAFLRRNNMLSP